MSNAQAGQGNEDELMDRETQLQLIEMGITSPVTKESAGEAHVCSFLLLPRYICYHFHGHRHAGIS